VVLVVVIGLLLLGAGVTLLLRGLTFPGGTAESLGQIESYGFAAQPVAGSGSAAGNRPLMGLAARLGGLAQRFVGVGEHGLRAKLLAAGMYETDPLTIVGYRVLAAVLLPVAWIWISTTAGMSGVMTVLGAAVLGVIGWTLPVGILSRRGRQRTERIDYELPELIDLLVVTLEAGLSFLASLHTAAARIRGPLGVELRLMLQEQRMGLTVNDALESMLRRCETPALRTFVRSVIQGESLGVSTGQIMRNLALEMRKRRRAKAEERAQKAPIKMLFPLIFLIFPAMFIVLLGPVYWSLTKAFGGS
jgi:tight adherence protein C